jgi:hypothetical protein
VDSRTKFCLLTLAGREIREPAADFAFFAHDPADLHRPGVRFELTPEEIQLLNPNTGTCPVFRSRRDAEITLGIYKRVPVLINENDPTNGNKWGISFMRMFDMSNDSHLFHTREELETEGWTLAGNAFHQGADEMLPLSEAKMIHHYDHRWATYEPDGTVRDVTVEEKQDPNFVVMPRYWVRKREIDARLDGRWERSRLLGWRRIARSTDERTIIAATVDAAAFGDSIFLMLPTSHPSLVECLEASLCSLPLDFAARQKIGGTNASFFLMEQIPVPSPDTYADRRSWTPSTLAEWVTARVAWREASSRDESSVDALSVRTELDAAMFHLYGIDRDDVDYIMETFPIVKRKDIAAHGEYRTKRLILNFYDQMAEAQRTSTPYRSPFDDFEAAL